MFSLRSVCLIYRTNRFTMFLLRDCHIYFLEGGRPMKNLLVLRKEQSGRALEAKVGSVMRPLRQHLPPRREGTTSEA